MHIVFFHCFIIIRFYCLCFLYYIILMSHIVGSRLNPERAETSFFKQECHWSQVRCMYGLCSFTKFSHFFRFGVGYQIEKIMEFWRILGNNAVVMYYRLNRALEEAEKYKTALQKAKSQSKVSQVSTGIWVCVCLCACFPPTCLVSACLCVCLSVFVWPTW